METSAKRPDRRVIKTKRAIRNAFAQLISQKEVGSITVKDIADTADINRKTFYNYYDGVYQIVDEIEDEIVTAFAGALKDIDFADVLKNPYLIFARVSAAISRDVDFYSHLFKRGENSSLTAKIISTLKDKIKSTFASQITVEPVQLDLIADYSIAGIVAVFRKWFSSSHDVPLEQLSDWLSRLAFSGINGLLAAGSVTLPE